MVIFGASASSRTPTRTSGWSGPCRRRAPDDERLGIRWLGVRRPRRRWCCVLDDRSWHEGQLRPRHRRAWLSSSPISASARTCDWSHRHRVALTVDWLKDAIGVSGSVDCWARDYRRAVDERLFGLGDLRDGALIDLLIRVRRRSRPASWTSAASPPRLTAASAADQALIADVAEAFARWRRTASSWPRRSRRAMPRSGT